MRLQKRYPKRQDSVETFACNCTCGCVYCSCNSGAMPQSAGYYEQIDQIKARNRYSTLVANSK